MSVKMSSSSNTFSITKNFGCTLLNLQTCSKHIINKLTVLARNNTAEAPLIVKLIEDYLLKVRYDLHLPVLYLVDSIAKNVKDPYAKLFSQNILSIFSNIADKSRFDEKRMEVLNRLRNTWVEVFPAALLHRMDLEFTKIHQHTAEEIAQEEIKVDMKIIKKKNEIWELQRKLEAIEAACRAKTVFQKSKKSVNVKKRLSDTFSDMEDNIASKRLKVASSTPVSTECTP